MHQLDGQSLWLPRLHLPVKEEKFLHITDLYSGVLFLVLGSCEKHHSKVTICHTHLLMHAYNEL